MWMLSSLLSSLRRVFIRRLVSALSLVALATGGVSEATFTGAAGA